ncbi:hypothetical protein G8759_14380 [Spirosoma aureum]|uniref:Uncharacterized protein n=1 Tax=Spirosoma aureum TaxID=2692134 RepID=A0A6G9AMS6_9BACT|nr:hypothetical protein [Spirosoma aureum]QIP13718.1 hypothetical protein G8759_14380 [Spirosoma aureum]
MKTSCTDYSKKSWLTLQLMDFSLVQYAKATWTLSVAVAVEKQTAHLYEATLSKPIDQVVQEQMTTVNANFNSSPNVNGIYTFRIDSIYEFESPASTKLFRHPPNYTFDVINDGFSTTSQGGGWLVSYKVICHKWLASKIFESGPFGPGATDGLTLEFGHARGALTSTECGSKEQITQSTDKHLSLSIA